MKAALVRSFGAEFVIDDIELDAPAGHEVLVDVKASGLCHTDLSMSRHDVGWPLPLLPGHEIAGVVEAVGPDVSGLAVGDHVVACLVRYCGVCGMCVTGRQHLCRNPDATLRTSDAAPRVTSHGAAVTQTMGLGGFAEKSLVHERQLVKVSPEIPFPQAALLGCGVVTGAGTVINTADTQAGDAIVVIGTGGVGLNAISGGVIAGASTIIAIDVSDEKLEMAKRFGATHTINSSRVDSVATVLEITGTGADAVFDFVGITPVTRQAFDMTAVGGGLYLIGVGGDMTGSLDLSLIELINTQKRVQGTLVGSTTPKRDIPMLVDLYLAGRLNLDELVSREIGLDEINEGYAALREPGVARVVITSF